MNPVCPWLTMTRQQLIQTRVIGGVVDDFNPRIRLTVVYGNERINVGDVLSVAEIRNKPNGFRFTVEEGGLDENIINSNLVLVMTDTDAPTGEYVHWMISGFKLFSSDGRIEAKLDPFERIPYEPPSATATGHRIVFTLFKINRDPRLILLDRREIFNTRDFANSNALGSPVAAAMFYVVESIRRINSESATSSSN